MANPEAVKRDPAWRREILSVKVYRGLGSTESRPTFLGVLQFLATIYNGYLPGDDVRVGDLVFTRSSPSALVNDD
jgi:hypothetical protein